MNKTHLLLRLLWIAIIIGYALSICAQSADGMDPLVILPEKVPLGTESVQLGFGLGNFKFSDGNAEFTLAASLIEEKETLASGNGPKFIFQFTDDRLTSDTIWDRVQFTIGKPALVIRDPASGKPEKTFEAVAEPFERTFVFQNPERAAAENRSRPAAASGSGLPEEFQASADNAQIQFNGIKIENNVLTYTLTSGTERGEFRFENAEFSSFSDSSVIGVKTDALVVQVNFILPDGTALPISYDLSQDCGFEGRYCNLAPEDF